jgi:hypothetical protein
MKHNEAQLINLFNEYLHEQAQEYGHQFNDFSLGGDDVVLADWLYRSSDLFMLVEFKDGAAGYLKEREKTRRERLCQLLPIKPDMRRLHRKCHFIAWGDGGGLFANIYLHQVCNAKVFPAKITQPSMPDVSTVMNSGEFAERLLSREQPVGLELDAFETYVAWLVRATSGEQDLTLQLIVRDRTSARFATRTFGSVSALDAWIRKTLKPAVAPSVPGPPSATNEVDNNSPNTPCP